MRYDSVVVGAGHNGLTCAAYLARAGRSVLVLERSDVIGGAARSARLFPEFGARLSAYSYLVSLMPQQIIDELALDLQLYRRRISSYTPTGDTGILIDNTDPDRVARDLGADAAAWDDFYGMTSAVAERLFPTMLEPLRSASDVRAMLGPRAWDDLFAEPIGTTLEQRFRSDTVRGIALTDGLIGTFAEASSLDLLANRCLLYHVIGRGTGDWDVPVGGMGRVTDALHYAAVQAGAQVRLASEVSAIETDGELARVRLVDGLIVECDSVFVNAAPPVLDRLRGRGASSPLPEGSQLKINVLVSRLPRLKDASLSPEQAFAGTFHINEGYAALQTAFDQASRGRMPAMPPCEVYCHSLSDSSIMDADLADAGAHTLTLFGLHMPARLFREDPDGARDQAMHTTLASINSVLAEPIQDCLLDPSTIDVRTPLDIEASVGMPGGHIFHGDLQWPFAESAEEVGTWGVETADPNIFICGSGARRGGGVSGIPGRNAVAAYLGEDALDR